MSNIGKLAKCSVYLSSNCSWSQMTYRRATQEAPLVPLVNRNSFLKRKKITELYRRPKGKWRSKDEQYPSNFRSGAKRYAWLSRFWFISLYDWSRKLVSDSNLKPNATWSLMFSRVSSSFHAFTLRCRWLILSFSFFRIGRCYFGLFLWRSLDRRNRDTQTIPPKLMSTFSIEKQERFVWTCRKHLMIDSFRFYGTNNCKK